MSEVPRGLRARPVEIATAVGFAALGGIAMFDSARIGFGWGFDGPQSGTFPYWVGALLMLASGAVLAGAVLRRTRAMFATSEQLASVARVFIPAILYVAAMHAVGLYVASAGLLAWFMIRLGGYPWPVAIASGVATAVIIFVVFELWFLVSLPKGPLEELLGY